MGGPTARRSRREPFRDCVSGVSASLRARASRSRARAALSAWIMRGASCSPKSILHAASMGVASNSPSAADAFATRPSPSSEPSVAKDAPSLIIICLCS